MIHHAYIHCTHSMCRQNVFKFIQLANFFMRSHIFILFVCVHTPGMQHAKRIYENRFLKFYLILPRFTIQLDITGTTLRIYTSRAQVKAVHVHREIFLYHSEKTIFLFSSFVSEKRHTHMNYLHSHCRLDAMPC